MGNSWCDFALVYRSRTNPVLLSHGTRRKSQLRGESGVEKLEVPAEQTPEAFAQLLTSDAAVEFAEPNFLIRHDQFRRGDVAATINRSMPALDGRSSMPMTPQARSREHA